METVNIDIKTETNSNYADCCLTKAMPDYLMPACLLKNICLKYKLDIPTYQVICTYYWSRFF